MDLHADPVELLLHRARAEHGQRLGDRSGRARQHRLDRPPHPQGHGAQRLGPVGEHRLGDPGQGAVQHHRPAQLGRGYPGGRGHALQGHGVERALAHLARQQAAQEGLLGLGGRAEQPGDDPAAPGGGPGAGLGREAADRRVDVADGEGGPRRRCGLLGQGAPADAGTALREASGEVGDDQPCLLGRSRGEELREQCALAGPGGSGGDFP